MYTIHNHLDKLEMKSSSILWCASTNIFWFKNSFVNHVKTIIIFRLAHVCFPTDYLLDDIKTKSFDDKMFNFLFFET